jgi:NAD+ kinase
VLGGVVGRDPTCGSVVVMHVVVVAHHERSEAGDLAEQIASWCAAEGHVAWMPGRDAAALGLPHLASERAPASADLVVSLGGDGTMLRAVHLLDGASVPIIGVNVGLLGYLAEVEPAALVSALERFSIGAEVGDWVLEHRMMVETTVRSRDERLVGSHRGLNEAVLDKLESGHTVRLAVSIDGAPFTSYAADGLIIATPTGSTAYSLSARGPVVSPRLRALLLTPVSPHMLFDRTLVLDPDDVVEIEVLGHRPVVLTIDGRRVGELDEGDVVRCEASSSSAAFVRFGRRRFHQILKTKFGLSDR